jgi:hypothetical protein
LRKRPFSAFHTAPKGPTLFSLLESTQQWSCSRSLESPQQLSPVLRKFRLQPTSTGTPAFLPKKKGGFFFLFFFFPFLNV